MRSFTRKRAKLLTNGGGPSKYAHSEALKDGVTRYFYTGRPRGLNTGA